MLNFVKETKFDKLGVFTYSQEEGTVAAEMEGQIEENIKEERLHSIMMAQQTISTEINENKIGRTYDVLIESKEKGTYCGRSYEMAPEIDGEVYVKSNKLSIGDFVKVRIKDALEYDLIGEILK